MSVTRSPAETRALGRSLAAHLRPGDLVCLYGELGAGKTTFVQGLADGLNVPDAVTSPSFTLIHEHRGRLHFYHVDLYRLGPGDLFEAGVEETVRSDGVTAVEWAERLPRSFRRDALEIEIAFTEDERNARRIRFRARGPTAARILGRLAEELDAGPGT